MDCPGMRSWGDKQGWRPIMRLSDLEQYKTITIQCHDNPDADALGAGYGLYRYFADRDCKVRLIYSGPNKVQKSNLKLMIEKLNIPIEYVPVNSVSMIQGLLLLVDCQYGASNVSRFEAEHVAVIDHHPVEKTDLEQFRIQSDLGSCATLVWTMLKQEKYSVDEDVELGTALYYGLFTDTNQFAELFHPVDMDMRESLTINKRLLTMFRNANLSLKELEIAGIAMIRYNYNDDYRFAVIKSNPCDPNILGLISDFLLQVDVVDTCLVYNEVNGGYKISVRSCVKEVNANELAAYLTEGIGSGGGHYEKAGGFISMTRYEEKYPTLHSEAYFNNRMTEYFDSFTILSAKDMKTDITGMKRYARRKEPICYIKAMDIVKPGTDITIRTGKKSMDCVAGEDSYFIIEKDGVVHYISEERFLKYLSPVDMDMPDEYKGEEYVSVIKNRTDDKTYYLTDHMKVCVPTDEFCIYAKELDSSVKLFPLWDEDEYMLGMPGDYLTVNADEITNVFIEPGDNFLKRYQEI